MSVLEVASKCIRSGMSVIPILPDGTKRPAIGEWKPFQERIVDEETSRKWFANGSGIAAICGRVSGNLEQIDFETEEAFHAFDELVLEHGSDELIEKYRNCILVKTPGPGRHLGYRSTQRVSGNQKLAFHELRDGQKNPDVLIETRAEGGYVLLPGSPPKCHQSGRPYELLSGDYGSIPVLTSEERDLFLSIARSLSRWIPKPKTTVTGQPPNMPAGLKRPGDDFNSRANWFDILPKHGWKMIQQRGPETRWMGPGKHSSESSAVSNHYGDDKLYVFSNNVSPFEPEKAYTKFGAYALLEHDGDFNAAAKALADKGYGEKIQTKVLPSMKVPEASSWESLEQSILPVSWAWEGWLANGFATMLAAEVGEGKSGLALKIAEPFLNGSPWPDGSKFNGKMGSIVWCECEAAQALNFQRAKNWGLPVNKILSPLRDPLMDIQLDLQEHRSAVASIMKREDVRLLILDSLRGSHSGDENSSDTVSVVKLIAEIARNSGKPCIIIHHLRKRNETDSREEITLDRLRGSSALVQMVRLVWAIDRPNLASDKRRLSVIKSNLAKFPSPIGFEIDESGISFGSAPRVVKAETTVSKATDLLLTLLGKGPVPSADLTREFEGAGLSWDSAKKAKDKLGIIVYRKDFRWFWSLPFTTEVE